MLAFCATICGCQNCVKCAESCEDAQDIMAEFIELPHGTPSHDYVALSQAVAPDEFLAVVRSHGDVENGPDWPLDVVFHEDMARSREDHVPADPAILRAMF